MRTRTRLGMLRWVGKPSNTVRVVLVLEPGDLLSGRMRGPAGEDELFRGWLELAGRLERVRPTASPQTAAATGTQLEVTADGSAPLSEQDAS